MQLFNKFREQIHIEPGQKVLLAVSGGIDSMVMMHLFHRLKISCTIAHCNFQLRGQESDDDEAFVRQQASDLYYKIFVSRFETTEYASENHVSIQMAARELRYTWFQKLVKVHEIDYIAIAHNRDDAMETFFINLGRGSGIAGLTGIRPVTGNIIRPLLFATRTDIESFSKENDIPFREDSSNTSDKYLRNYIRHQIIPDLEEVFPNFRESMAQNLEKINDAFLLYQHSLESFISDVTRIDEKLVYIDIPKLLQTPAPKTILFEILRTYGFSSATVEEIYHLVNAMPGKQFLSTSHKVIKDRDCFIVSKLVHDKQERFYIEDGIANPNLPIALTFEIITKTPQFMIEKNPLIAFLDYDKLEFPLILRKWQPGDYFTPLGMTGMKKLSDFFIDQKLSIIEKENLWLLTSGNHIVWIVGKRIDDRYKVTESTMRILKVCLLTKAIKS
jgi:tRNA(Ile)-lysidine synthase